MRGSPLTTSVTVRELSRLLDVYRRPEHYPTDIATLAQRFLSVCGDVSAEQFTQAVTAYLKSPAQWFPKPGQLRGLAMEQPGILSVMGEGTLEQRYWAWEKDGWADPRTGAFEPCPVCGSAVEPTGRVVVKHDHQRHYEAGIGYVGPRTGPMERGGMAPMTGARPDHRAAAAGDAA